MLVTVLKESYVIVLSEDNKDERWLKQAAYDSLGEDYYQEVFKDFDMFLEEVEYLIQHGATFEETSEDDSPFKVLQDLKLENFIK